ncbi:Panacea domain-containing protein [Brevibacillus formosus]
MLRSNPKSIKQFFDQNKHKFEPDELKTVEKKLELYIANDDLEDYSQRLMEKIYKLHDNTINTGGSKFNSQKLLQMVLFFSKERVLKTKLMKLLWYADFLRYKRARKPISGTPYCYLPFGPVPKNHDFILGTMSGLDLISIREEENADGYTIIHIQAKRDFDPNFFNNDDLDVLRYVDNYFKNYGSREIYDFAQNEAAWKETVDEQIISYQYADSLQLS